MGCSTGGCGSSSGGSGGCNRMNTYDWFADIPLAPGEAFNIVEVSFKNGSRKEYFKNSKHLDLFKGDLVVVKASVGYDVGEVSLSGELVKMQMRKKKVKDDENILSILRIATEEEVQKLKELRNKENETMKMARVIAREQELEMKIGDVEYQGDGKKVTFYYTSDGRVDFRELVKKYVTNFKTKIEMRQIGARQEAQRLGGVGSCGRELCCSSFLNEFKSVTTGAARYQQLSINSDKLSGQCGRLKCCLNYELDTYTEALKTIPKKVDKLKTEEGTAYLRKTDIFKMEMTYNINKTSTYYKLSVEDVRKVQKMNRDGEIPKTLANFNIVEEPAEKEKNYDDLVGQVSLNTLVKKPKSRNKKKRRNNNNSNNRQNTAEKTQANTNNNKQETASNRNTQRKPNRQKKRRKPRPQKPNDGNKS
ncbi:MAG: PSP1 domain-containing protein [Chitinophagales bacterium]